MTNKINIKVLTDERNNLKKEEKEKIKNDLLYSRKPVDFLIYNFIEILEKDESINLDLFYKNLQTLKVVIDDTNIKKTNKLYKKEGELIAYYRPSTNTLFLPTNFKTIDLYHELFHVASTKEYKNNTINSGIYYCDYKYSLNDFLNEGYTELLIKRYFNLELDDIYEDHIHSVNLFEDIIGKEKLSNYYFTADFNNFITDLLKFNTDNEIYKFLSIKVYKNIKYVRKFLKEIYIKALYNQLFNNQITSEEFEYKIAYFFKRFKFENIDKECELILDNYVENIKIKYNKIILKHKLYKKIKEYKN